MVCTMVVVVLPQRSCEVDGNVIVHTLLSISRNWCWSGRILLVLSSRVVGRVCGCSPMPAPWLSQLGDHFPRLKWGSSGLISPAIPSCSRTCGSDSSYFGSGRRWPWLALEVLDFSSHILQRLLHGFHLLLKTLHCFAVKISKLLKYTDLLVNFLYLISSLIRTFFKVNLLELVSLLLQLFAKLLEFTCCSNSVG